MSSLLLTIGKFLRNAVSRSTSPCCHVELCVESHQAIHLSADCALPSIANCSGSTAQPSEHRLWSATQRHGTVFRTWCRTPGERVWDGLSNGDTLLLSKKLADGSGVEIQGEESFADISVTGCAVTELKLPSVLWSKRVREFNSASVDNYLCKSYVWHISDIAVVWRDYSFSQVLYNLICICWFVRLLLFISLLVTRNGE